MSDKDTPIMMGNTKPMVITGVVKVKIAKPDFDITKHEWSSEDIIGVVGASDWLHIDLTHYCRMSGTNLRKNDAIAIAKHFKLTEADLC